MGPKKVRKIYFILFHLRGGVVGVKVKDSLTNFPKMSNSIIFLRVFGVLGGGSYESLLGIPGSVRINVTYFFEVS